MIYYIQKLIRVNQNGILYTPDGVKNDLNDHSCYAVSKETNDYLKWNIETKRWDNLDVL